MNAFTIRDLENLSGIKAHTIRIWEQRYSFLKPKRSSTNIRYYDSEELKTLLNVSLLNKYGFKISQIDKMEAVMMKEKILSLSSIEAKQERMINDLLHAMIDFDSRAFELTIDHHIQTHGVDLAIRTLIFPFLHRIGILWMTDHVRIAHEHLVSNIIRRKILVGIETTPNTPSNGKTVVMFLPDGEHHEIGLIYVHYLLKVQGLNVIYLGSDVPVAELEYICSIRQPDFLYTHLTSLPPKLNIEDYLQTLSKSCNNARIVVSGRMIQQLIKKLPQQVRITNSIEEVIGRLTEN